MRAEFGDSIDAHPGGVGTEAGEVNRAFRMAAYAILKGAGSRGTIPPCGRGRCGRSPWGGSPNSA